MVLFTLTLIYSYDSFLMRLIEITRTLILLFIMLHICGPATTRILRVAYSVTFTAIVEVFSYYELLNLKIKAKSNLFLLVFCSLSILSIKRGHLVNVELLPNDLSLFR